MKTCTASALLLSAVLLSAQASQAAEDVLIVYDASASMWGQIDGVNKITTARNVMAGLVHDWPRDTNLGLVAYGHRRAGDCTDIETLIKPQPVEPDEFVRIVNAINPKGKTPIAASLQHAANVLQYRDNNATVVLISDGLESCHGDPCAVAAELAARGTGFTAHVVGFDLDEQANEALSCIASNTGGVFVPASNASELQDALQQVQARVTQQQAESVTEPEPEVEEEAESREVFLSAPDQVVTGAPFEISWSPTLHPRDYYTIVPAGSREGGYTSWERVKQNHAGQLVAPAEPGLYEVRYVLDNGGKTLASVPVEVVEAELGISAPQQVTAGAPFEVQWSSVVNPRDYYTIVPAGSREGGYTSWERVKQNHAGQLVAPAEPGLYEVRYVLDNGGKTLASVPVEVVEAELEISAPASIRAGSTFELSWSQVVNSRDYYTIVPAGSKEGSYTSWERVGDKLRGQLRAPDEVGMYEVRYVLDNGGKTLASSMLEVVPVDAPLNAGVQIEAPATASPGTTVTVHWSGTGDGQDQRIVLAEDSAADFTWISAHKVDEATSQEFTLPGQPGRYEVRYLDISNTSVLGRAIIRIE